MQRKIFFITFGDFAHPTDGGSMFTKEVIQALSGDGHDLEIISYYEHSKLKSKYLRKILSAYYSVKNGAPIPVSYFFSKTFLEKIKTSVEESLRKQNFGKNGKIIVFIDHLELCYVAPALRTTFGERLEIIHISHNREPLLFEQRLKGNLIYKISEFICSYKDFEIESIRLIDGIISISASESDYFKETLSAEKNRHGKIIKVHTVPPAFSYPVSFQDSSQSKNIKKLVFLANFNWWPNVEAFNWIKGTLAPALPSFFQIHIYGKNSQNYSTGAPTNMIFHGFVDDIYDVWKNCFFSLAPINSGAGVNVKVAESLYNKIPVIGTPLAFEGISPTFLNGGVSTNLVPEKWIELLSFYSLNESEYHAIKNSIAYPSKAEIYREIINFI